jgi:hypothetical protein
VFIVDLLPDLAASVGHEHIDAFPEVTQMRRLLLVLIVLLIGVITFRAHIPQAYDTAGAWWEHRQDIAYQRAYSAHLDALAQVTEQQRRDTHDDVAAAILYWNAAEEGATDRLYHPDSEDSGNGVIDIATRVALRDRADTAFTRALKAGDRWALWLAVVSCPARPDLCAKDASLARLRQIDADNGAVWLLDMQAAQDAHEPIRARAALARLARSARFDSHYGDAMRSLLLAFDKRPVPPRLIVRIAGFTATPAQSAVLLAGQMATYGYVITRPALKSLSDLCRPKETQIPAERAADCRAAGLLISQRGSMSEQFDGYRVWLRNANDAERNWVRVSIRDYQWQRIAANQVASDTSENATRAWKTAWVSDGSEADVYRRLLRERGIPLQAPADFAAPWTLDPTN